MSGIMCKIQGEHDIPAAQSAKTAATQKQIWRAHCQGVQTEKYTTKQDKFKKEISFDAFIETHLPDA